MRNRNLTLRGGLRAGFTLVELLVVITIILIASSILFVGGSGGDGAKLSSSQRIVSGIVQGARGQAILKNAETRLIIHNDVDSDPDKYRRFFGIVYFQEDNPDTPENEEGWIAATQGTYLPEGVFFDPDLSRDWPDSTMRLEYPRQSARAEGAGAQAEEFYYYAFDSNGTVDSDYVNSWLAFRVGTLVPEGDSFEIDFQGKDALKAALILRRAGTTTPVTDPGDIN